MCGNLIFKKSFMSLLNMLFLFSALLNIMNVFIIEIVNKDIKRVNICVILGFVFND